MSEILCKGQKLIDSQRICCFNNESVTIKHHFDKNAVLEIQINFLYNDGEINYSIASEENGKVILNLYNFKSSLGSGLKKPQQIAAYNGKKISIVFFVTLLPEANPILDYSLYMEV